MKTSTFKPMLAGKSPEDLSELTFPLWASPKLDGIRCVKLNGKALSRKLKPIPNDYIRTWIEENLPDGVDGEILLPKCIEPFREVSSAVMKKSGEPDFLFGAFDYLKDEDCPDVPFRERVWQIAHYLQERPLISHHFFVVAHEQVNSKTCLDMIHEENLMNGFEGTMVRDPEGPYKFGRSTTREGYLLKVKKFDDEEALVIGVEERMHNTNELQRDELGNAKRSSAKAGKVGSGTMGKLLMRFADGTEFGCGTGFNDQQRKEIWTDLTTQHVRRVLGRVAKIKHQPDSGGRKIGQKPRFPVFLGWRED